MRGRPAADPPRGPAFWEAALCIVRVGRQGSPAARRAALLLCLHLVSRDELGELGMLALCGISRRLGARLLRASLKGGVLLYRSMPCLPGVWAVADGAAVPELQAMRSRAMQALALAAVLSPGPGTAAAEAMVVMTSDDNVGRAARRALRLARAHAHAAAPPRLVPFPDAATLEAATQQLAAPASQLSGELLAGRPRPWTGTGPRPTRAERALRLMFGSSRSSGPPGLSAGLPADPPQPPQQRRRRVLLQELWGCWNPACAGGGGGGLPGRPVHTLACSQCRKARYCCMECAVAHRPAHRAQCARWSGAGPRAPL